MTIGIRDLVGAISREELVLEIGCVWMQLGGYDGRLSCGGC